MTIYQEFTYTSHDGLRLYGRKYGWNNPETIPLVCLPGLTRHSGDFDSLATYLASPKGGKRRVITFDYRGRGNSQHDPNWENYNILTEAIDIITGLTVNGIGEAHFLGTSRGGIITMALSAARPALLKSVILNDIGPEIDAQGLVRIRRSLEKSRVPQNWEEAAANLQHNMASQFPNLTPKQWEHQARLIYREEDNGLTTRYDRNLLKTLRAFNIDQRLPDMWPQFKGLARLPVMVIHGKLSDLLGKKIINKMLNQHSDIEVVTVEDQGHAPMLEDLHTQNSIKQFLSKSKG